MQHINILKDDCCILSHHLETIESVTLKPIHLANIELTELKYADKKLSEFDEIITRQINQSFIVTYTKWYTIVFEIIITVLVLSILAKFCQNIYIVRPRIQGMGMLIPH